MLLLTDAPTRQERELALREVPWHADLRRLAGFSAAVLRNQSVDLIDAAVGPGHARAALVALQEGTDTLFQATLELAESAAREQVLARVRPADPLGLGERIEPPESEQGMRVRLARTALSSPPYSPLVPLTISRTPMCGSHGRRTPRPRRRLGCAASIQPNRNRATGSAFRGYATA
jgi:hypothetical protein